MDVIAAWNGLPEELRNNILRVLLGGIVLLLVWMLRRLLTWVLIIPLRALARRSNATWDDMLLDAIIGPLRVLILALGLVIGTAIIAPDRETIQFVDGLIRSLVVIALFLTSYRVIDAFAPSSNRVFSLTGMTIPEQLLPFFRTAAKIVILAIAIVAVFQQWSIDLNGLLAGGGLVALALGLAAQDTIANVFGFSAIVGDSPFIVGDFIKTPEVEGIVEKVGVRSTRIRQLDQAAVTVPNSKLTNAAVLNWSRLSKRWINMTLGITYNTSSSQMRELLVRLREMLLTRELLDPESVVVHFIDFGDSSLNILIRCYVMLSDWREFTREKEAINLEIMNIIETMGLSIAFPSRSVYIETMPHMFHGAHSQPQASTEENLPE